VGGREWATGELNGKRVDIGDGDTNGWMRKNEKIAMEIMMIRRN
jgi:hypothetical protein